MSTGKQKIGGPTLLLLVGIAVVAGLAPLAISTMRAAVDVTEMARILESMTKQIVITWDASRTTTYTGCTDYSVSDNGTITFTGTKSGSETSGDYVIGHGTYEEVEVTIES